jgi:hypothetical protein
METLTDKTIRVFNDQINKIKVKAYDEKQRTYVSIYTFDTWTKVVAFNMYPEAVPYLTRDNYVANGRSTALLDAVGRATTDLSMLPDADDINHSFLVVVITDGRENDSRKHTPVDIRDMLARYQGTDRWSFAFLTPARSKHLITALGVPAGNVQEWDPHAANGMDVVATSTSQGLDKFIESRAKGKKSTNTFFTNMAKVKKSDLAKLEDMSARFTAWTIPSEQDISAFVNGKLESPTLAGRLGPAYQPGRAFYQLTKSEKIQPHKDVCIMDKVSGKIFGGVQARQLVGIPLGEAVRVRPGNHMNFEIFVRSNSMNRKLVRGSKLLYSRV